MARARDFGNWPAGSRNLLLLDRRVNVARRGGAGSGERPSGEIVRGGEEDTQSLRPSRRPAPVSCLGARQAFDVLRKRTRWSGCAESGLQRRPDELPDAGLPRMHAGPPRSARGSHGHPRSGAAWGRPARHPRAARDAARASRRARANSTVVSEPPVKSPTGEDHRAVRVAHVPFRALLPALGRRLGQAVLRRNGAILRSSPPGAPPAVLESALDGPVQRGAVGARLTARDDLRGVFAACRRVRHAAGCSLAEVQRSRARAGRRTAPG